jgi:hypothetical protein
MSRRLGCAYAARSRTAGQPDAEDAKDSQKTQKGNPKEKGGWKFHPPLADFCRVLRESFASLAFGCPLPLPLPFPFPSRLKRSPTPRGC